MIGSLLYSSESSCFGDSLAQHKVALQSGTLSPGVSSSPSVPSVHERLSAESLTVASQHVPVPVKHTKPARRIFLKT